MFSIIASDTVRVLQGLDAVYTPTIYFDDVLKADMFFFVHTRLLIVLATCDDNCVVQRNLKFGT